MEMPPINKNKIPPETNKPKILFGLYRIFNGLVILHYLGLQTIKFGMYESPKSTFFYRKHALV